MSASAKYKTQSSMWDVQFGKSLSNRLINKYKKLGYYSSGIVKEQFKTEQKQKRKPSLADIFAGL